MIYIFRFISLIYYTCMSLSHIYSNITQLTYIESFLVMHLRKNKRWGFMTAQIPSGVFLKTKKPT